MHQTLRHQKLSLTNPCLRKQQQLMLRKPLHQTSMRQKRMRQKSMHQSPSPCYTLPHKSLLQKLPQKRDYMQHKRARAIYLSKELVFGTKGKSLDQRERQNKNYSKYSV